LRPSRQAVLKLYSSGARLLILAGLVLSGCAVAPAPSPPPAPGASLSREALLAGFARRMELLQSLRSPYRVRYRNRQERGGFHGAILVRRPDGLRLETLSLVGALLVLTADGDEVMAFLPREKVILRGKSSKANLLRFTRIPLGLNELTSLLLGLPPVKVEGAWDGNGSTFERGLPGGGGERVVLDSASGLPLQWQRTGPGGVEGLTANFSEFFETGAGLFPSKIALLHGPGESSWEIRYREPDVNVDMPRSLFVQQTPGAVRELPFESLGG